MSRRRMGAPGSLMFRLWPTAWPLVLPLGRPWVPLIDHPRPRAAGSTIVPLPASSLATNCRRCWCFLSRFSGEQGPGEATKALLVDGDGPGLKPKFVRLDWAGILLFLGVTGVTCSGGPPPYTLVLASRVCQLVPASELGPNEIVDVWDLGGPGLTARLEIALAPQVLDPKTKP